MPIPICGPWRCGIPAGNGWMPQRHGPQIGIGMKSWQVNLLAETKAGDCHADRLKAHVSC